MNKTWHDQNKIPKNASLEERIRWHTEHAKHCDCRPIPKNLLPKIKEPKPRAT